MNNKPELKTGSGSLHRLAGPLLCVLGTFVLAINLAGLMPHNEHYECAWWKVGLASFLIIAGFARAYWPNTRNLPRDE